MHLIVSVYFTAYKLKPTGIYIPVTMPFKEISFKSQSRQDNTMLNIRESASFIKRIT